MHADKILKLADLLDGLRPEQFDIRRMVGGRTIPTLNHDCKSAACGVGYTPLLFPTEVEYVHMGSCIEVHYIGHLIPYDELKPDQKVPLRARGFSNIASRLFDIPIDDAFKLFSPADGEWGRKTFIRNTPKLNQCGLHATPQQLAKLLRDYVRYMTPSGNA